MPGEITNQDLLFRQSERMTDNSDGGGMMTAVEVVSGVSNLVFDDLSDIALAGGQVSIRKIFACVTSPNTGKYLDAYLTILKPPANPNVSVVGFSTGSFYDERDDLADAVQQYRARGIDTRLRLIGTHNINQRILYGYLLNPLIKPVATLFNNAIISLAKETAGNIEYEQLVKVTRVTSSEATYLYMNSGTQTPYSVTEVVLDLAYPLQYSFPGANADPNGAYVPPTVIRTTQVVAPYTFIGVQPLAVEGAISDTVITLADTKSALVPVEYQDLGATTVNHEAGMISDVLAAPAGFTLVVPANPASIDFIAYQYGGEWVVTGDPNGATYFGGTISFPLRPDASSDVFVRWYTAFTTATENLTATGNYTLTGSTATAPLPLSRGRLTFRCIANPGVGPMHTIYGYDNGAGAVTGNITGTINYTTGAFVLQGGGAYAPYAYTLGSLALIYPDGTPSGLSSAALLPTGPIIESNVTVNAFRQSNGDLITGTDNGAGVITGTGISGTVDYITGLIELTYTNPVVDASIELQYNIGGVVPQSAAVLGIDPLRLPQDGRMPIYADNQYVIIHHTAVINEAGLTASEVINCGRTSLWRVVIEDVDKKRLPASFFTVDRALGTVTMSPSLSLTGYTAPFKVYHSIGHLTRLNRVSHSDHKLTLTKPLAQTFPISGSYVSSCYYIGTLQARYTGLFTQTTWTSVWSDSPIGSIPLAVFNDVLYPIIVTNAGAYPDRLLIKFKTTTTYDVIGEKLGLIAIGDTTANCVVQLPGMPDALCEIDYRAFGAGWSTGNCIRFNLIGALYPLAAVRAVQPSAPTGLSDSVEFAFVGNVDA